MPIGQFPGGGLQPRDGVTASRQNSYGGPDGLARLVNACHQRGLGWLDVVYNHLGPEGNYLHEFGHYFSATTRHGASAINFDDCYSDEVRRYFIENALHWVTDFHIDRRLDAVHAIFDESARPFLRELEPGGPRSQLSNRIAASPSSPKATRTTFVTAIPGNRRIRIGRPVERRFPSIMCTSC